MIKKILIIAIFIGAFGVRLYHIDSPVADWHSWRQVDTIAVSRNFVKHGINLLKPQYDDLSNVASGRENPEGLRMVEFPIYNAVVALVYQTAPIFSLEMYGRLITIISSLLTLLFIYLLTRKYVNDLAGICAAFFYAFLPFSVYYGRVLLPDPTAVMFAMGSLWLSSIFVESKKIIHLIFVTIFFAVALLIKPTAIFFGIPIAFAIVRNGRDRSLQKILLFSVIFSLAFLPFLLWRLYIQQFPEGIPASSWLLNGDGIRFKGAWFRWIFGERIGKLILGYWGVIFFGMGMFTKKNKNYIFDTLGFSSLLYLIIFATGNVRHDYYQILILPTVTIFCGLGLQYIVKRIVDVETLHATSLPKINWNDWGKYVNLMIVIFFVLLTLALSWYEVQGFFNINHPEIVEAGKMVDQIAPKNARVIAPYGGDTAFLYQTNRVGWPLLYDTNDVSKQIKLGATHYVSVNFDDSTKEIMEKCNILFQNEKYVIVELRCK